MPINPELEIMGFLCPFKGGLGFLLGCFKACTHSRLNYGPPLKGALNTVDIWVYRYVDTADRCRFGPWADP